MRLHGHDLTCVRGGRTVFRNLSFTVARGEALVLTGPNGAGKSSLLRVVAGLLATASGSVELEGGADDLSPGEQSHYIAHADALKPTMTAAENIGFWAAYYGGGDPGAALDAVRLSHVSDTPAGLLSAGQKRRLALARLHVAARPVWLLDEPSVSLDAAAQADLTELMQSHVAGGGILMAATHLPLGLADARTMALEPGAP